MYRDPKSLLHGCSEWEVPGLGAYFEVDESSFSRHISEALITWGAPCVLLPSGRGLFLQFYFENGDSFHLLVKTQDPNQVIQLVYEGLKNVSI